MFSSVGKEEKGDGRGCEMSRKKTHQLAFKNHWGSNDLEMGHLPISEATVYLPC